MRYVQLDILEHAGVVHGATAASFLCRFISGRTGRFLVLGDRFLRKSYWEGRWKVPTEMGRIQD